MNIVPGWPRALGDLAPRYSDAAEALFTQRGFSDPDKFDLAFDIAVNACERARAYDWAAEEAHIAQMREFAAMWPSAAAGAMKLAAALEKGGTMTSKAVRLAMHESEIFLKSEKKLRLSDGLAALVKQVGQYRFRFHGERYRIPYGPLEFELTGRLDLPPRSVVLTIAIAHQFKRHVFGMADSRVITGGSGWEAAETFARASGLAGKENELALGGRRWLARHKGKHEYVGWPSSGVHLAKK